MGYGLLDIGNSIKQQGDAGLRKAAADENARNIQRENIANAKKSQQKSTAATFVGYGAKHDYSQYLDGQETANGLDNVSPTYDGASGEFGQSQVGTDVGLDGVTQTSLDQSAVSTTPDVLEQATVDQFSKEAGKEVATEAGKEVAVEAGKEVATEAAADLAVETAAEAAVETVATEAATQAATQAAVSTAGTGAALGEAAAAGSTFGPWGTVAAVAASVLINSLFD